MGGDSGPAVVPGNPDKSLIIQMIKSTDPDKQMPPRVSCRASGCRPRTVGQARWHLAQRTPAKVTIAKTNGPANLSGIGYDQLRREHWAWQPVKPQQPPAVKSTAWAYTDIDKFVLAKLEDKGLKPVADADRITLSSAGSPTT